MELCDSTTASAHASPSHQCFAIANQRREIQLYDRAAKGSLATLLEDNE